jgi:hypothetical protein
LRIDTKDDADNLVRYANSMGTNGLDESANYQEKLQKLQKKIT